VEALEDAIEIAAQASKPGLIWDDEFGFGYYPCNPAEAPYDAAYFAKYQGYADTEMGLALTQARIRLVGRYWHGHVVDIGIGCGSFVEARPLTWGYDVNPAAVSWLHEQMLYCNPYIDHADAVTMWDSLEHIQRFPDLLENVRRWAFVSLPVFANGPQTLLSHHYRPTEHYWYFTPAGLKTVMHDLGWTCVETNWAESEIGRGAVASFAFRRHA
jgi:hypothetical protein